MLNPNMLRAKIAENGMTQKEVASRIGMSEKTFSLKIKNGKFGLDEADQLIKLLNIDRPELVFFAQQVTRPADLLLKQLECPNGHIGFAIETGEEIEEKGEGP